MLGKACDKYGFSRVDSVYTALHAVTIKAKTNVGFIVVTKMLCFESITHRVPSMICIKLCSYFV